MKIIIKFSKTLVIGFVFIVIIVLLVLWFMDIYRSQKEKLHSEAFIFFTEAMQKEKKQRITVRKKYYDSQKSLNDFSEEEKNAWFNKTILQTKIRTGMYWTVFSIKYYWNIIFRLKQQYAV